MAARPTGRGAVDHNVANAWGSGVSHEGAAHVGTGAIVSTCMGCACVCACVRVCVCVCKSTPYSLMLLLLLLLLVVVVELHLLLRPYDGGAEALGVHHLLEPERAAAKGGVSTQRERERESDCHQDTHTRERMYTPTHTQTRTHARTQIHTVLLTFVSALGG